MPAAVLCIAFNRPDLLEQVLAAIGEAGPRRVFVSIDGARPGNPDDPRLRAEVRAAVERLEWPTEIAIRDLDQNLGCAKAVNSAVAWAFESVEELIVFEDDCLPDSSFLRFCDELLERYRDDERVMQISGTNWGAKREKFAGHSYAFTSFPPAWGWATWRRAWALNDEGLSSWPRVRATGIAEGMGISPRFRRLLERDWARFAGGGEGEWDHQWQYSILRNHGLNVCPARNLVVNIGFRPDGTHLQEPDLLFGNLPRESMPFPLDHPPEVAPNAIVNAVFSNVYWQKKAWPARAFGRLMRNKRLRLAARRTFRRFVPHPS